MNYPSSMPFDTIAIHDQSAYVESTITAVDVDTKQSGPMAFIPFVSPRGYGEDNKLMYLNSVSFTKFGTPNYKKYGLSMYLADQYIKGGGTVVGLRMVPSDASHANLGVFLTLTHETKNVYTEVVDTTTGESRTVPVYVDTNGERQDKVRDGISYDGSKYYLDTSKVTWYDYGTSNLSIDENTGDISATRNGQPSAVIYRVMTVDKLIGRYSTESVAKATNVRIMKSTFNSKYGIYDSNNQTSSAPTDLTLDVRGSDGNVIDFTTVTTGMPYFINPANPDEAPTTIDDITYNISTGLSSASGKITDDVSTGWKVEELSETVGSLALKKYKITKTNQETSDTITYVTNVVGGETHEYTLDDFYGTEYSLKVKIPVFLLYSRTAGDFANNFNFYMTYDDTMETTSKDNGYTARFYKLFIYDGSSRLENTMSVSFNDEFMYNGLSMYMEDVIDLNAINTNVIMGSNLETLKTILSKYMINPDRNIQDEVSVDNIDFIFGGTKDQTAYFNYEVDSTSAGCINLSSLTKFYLANGSLGSFAYETDEQVRNDAIKDELVNAYIGQTTDLVLDEVRFPFIHIFSCTDDPEVCSAMATLVDNRKSTIAFFQMPEPANGLYSEVRNTKRTTYDAFNGYDKIFVPESAFVYDTYTSKKIRMPSTYFNAYSVARWAVNYGYKRPLAGQYHYWSGFVRNSLLPRSTNKDEYIQNHNYGLNTMIEDGNGYAYPYEQITSQTITSSLSEINNVHVLKRMCSIALALAQDTRWIDLGDTEISYFKSQLQSRIENELTGAYDTLSISALRESVNGAGRNRIHCILNVSFKDIFKGVTFDFYVLPKTTL